MQKTRSLAGTLVDPMLTPLLLLGLKNKDIAKSFHCLNSHWWKKARIKLRHLKKIYLDHCILLRQLFPSGQDYDCPQSTSCLCSVLSRLSGFLYHTFLRNASTHSASWGTLLTPPTEGTLVLHRFHQLFLCALSGDPRPGCPSPGKKKTLTHIAKPFSWNYLTTLHSNCSGLMFRTFPETKGHCHNQGLVQCALQKEGRKVNIENWGDIQHSERHNERKTARKWFYNGAKSRVLGPWYLFRQPPPLAAELWVHSTPGNGGNPSQKLVRTFPLSLRAKLLF